MTPSVQKLPMPVLDAWHHCGSARSTAWVYPDGCCDLIWSAPPGETPVWFVTELADATYAVDCQAQHAMFGFRLRPGVLLDSQALLRAVASIDARDEQRLLSLLGDIAKMDLRVEEALSCLALSLTVRDARRTLGVSERSLERLVRGGAGRSPI